MAATNFTPISLYYSATASATPSAGNLVAGELAINTADGKLFYKDSSGVVQTLASKAGNVNVSSFSAGTTGLTPSTATTGVVTLAGTLNVANGGTGLTSLSSGYIPYGSGTSAFSSSANLYFSGTALGIGTSIPNAPLHVVGEIYAAQASANSQQIRITPQASGANIIYSTYSGTNSYLPLAFNVGGSEAMRIDSSGNLLVGTTTGGTGITSGLTLQPNSGASFQQIGHVTGTASGAQYIGFSYNGSLIANITQSGTTAVLYNVTSDQRLKTNIVDAPSGNIDNIKVRSFNWIADNSLQEYGFIAQELLEVAPYAVHQPQDAEEMMAVDYSKLVPMMIKEIQDLKAEVTQLKAKVGI